MIIPFIRDTKSTDYIIIGWLGESPVVFPTWSTVIHCDWDKVWSRLAIEASVFPGLYILIYIYMHMYMYMYMYMYISWALNAKMVCNSNGFSFYAQKNKSSRKSPRSSRSDSARESQTPHWMSAEVTNERFNIDYPYSFLGGSLDVWTSWYHGKIWQGWQGHKKI